MNITELFNSLKAYINSVIGDKITIIEGKTVEAGNSATDAANSADSAASSADAAANAVEQRITELVGQAPETMDTLEEFAASLGDDPNFSTTMFQRLGEKADTADVDAALAEKSDEGHTHTPEQVGAAKGVVGSAVVQRWSSGSISVPSQPTANTDAVSKAYVDDRVATREPKSWTGTQAQFDALATKDPDTTYNIVSA